MTKRFERFFNKENNSDRIYTREDITKMSNEEFLKDKNAIYNQMIKVGVPYERELANSNDVVYIQPYKRQDGTKVNGYYRSMNGRLSAIGLGQKSQQNNPMSGIYSNPMYGNGLLQEFSPENYLQPDAMPTDYPQNDNLMDKMQQGSEKLLKGGVAYYQKLNNALESGRNAVHSYINKTINGAFGTKNASVAFDTFIYGENNPDLKNEANVYKNGNMLRVEYKPDSKLSRTVSSSPELKEKIKKNIGNKSFEVSFDKNDENDTRGNDLYLTLHNATVRNLRMRNGYYEGYLEDVYDFAPQSEYKKDYYKGFIFGAANDYAYLMQKSKTGKPYEIKVPFKVKI